MTAAAKGEGAKAALDALLALSATATLGEWMLATSCSWRRILTTDGKPVIVPSVQRSDNHPDLDSGEDHVNAELAIAAVNFIREHGEALRAALPTGGKGAVGVVTTDFNAHACTGVKWLPGIVPAEGVKVYTAPPSALPVDALVALAEKWRAESAERRGLIDYTPQCADELTAILAGAQENA